MSLLVCSYPVHPLFFLSALFSSHTPLLLSPCSGAKMQSICDECAITLNKNTVPGDTSALNPGGVRLGSSALTTRGFNASHFHQVADFLHRAVQISLDIQKQSGKTLKAFKEALPSNAEVAQLKLDVKTFATQFPMPGFDTSTMRYRHRTETPA
jgi:glycine hydroxymethyltransferase